MAMLHGEPTLQF